MMLAEQVRQARARAQLSIYALAKQSGIGVATIADIEAGRNTNPGIVTMTKLADVLQVSLDALAERPRAKPRRKRTPQRAAGEEEAAFCPGCGVEDGAHQLDCPLLAPLLADDPVAQAAVERAHRLTTKLRELAGQEA